jgi:high-affinity iron transporter
VFYWVAVVVALTYMKWSEGRCTFFGIKSAAGKRRDVARAAKLNVTREKDGSSLSGTPSEKNK